jgi:peptidoglycan hydrolase CwlO-like protein
MAIQFFNGPLIYEKLHSTGNRFRQLAGEGKNDEDIIKELYLAALNRYPATEELQASLNHISAKKQEFIEEGPKLQEQLVQLQAQVAQLRSTVRERLRDAKLATLPENIRADVKQAVASAPDGRTEVQRYLVEKLGPLVDVADAEIDAGLNEQEKPALEALQKQVADTQQRIPGPDTYRGVALEDVCWALLNTNEFLFQH